MLFCYSIHYLPIFTLGTWPASCSRSSPRWSRAARTIWWSSASCLRQERSTCQGFRKSLGINCFQLFRGYLSLGPFFQDAKQRPFRRSGRHEHSLELRGDRDRDFLGRVVYVVARCGVQGIIYPIKTDVELKGKGNKFTVFYGTIQFFFAPLSEKRFPLSVDAFREGEVAAIKAKELPEVCDREEKMAGGEIEAFCLSGDRVSVGLGRVERAAKSATAGGDAAAVTLTRLDADRSSSRPSFSVSRESGRLQVNFERVSRDDEGAYEVAVADGEGKLEKKFDYTLVVMGKKGSLLLFSRWAHRLIYISRQGRARRLPAAGHGVRLRRDGHPVPCSAPPHAALLHPALHPVRLPARHAQGHPEDDARPVAHPHVGGHQRGGRGVGGRRRRGQEQGGVAGKGGREVSRSRLFLSRTIRNSFIVLLRTHINPRILSGLTDLYSSPGTNAEIKCYLLSTPGSNNHFYGQLILLKCY